MIPKLRRRLEDPLRRRSRCAHVRLLLHLFHDDEPPARVRAQDLLAVGRHAQRRVARRIAGLLPGNSIGFNMKLYL